MPSHSTQHVLTVRAAVMFFIPLIMMTELHQVSHSMVHAFLARLPDATTTLAAITVAFSFNTTFSSMQGVSTPAGIAYIKDKPSFWRVVRFYSIVSLIPFVIIESVALTPLGDWLFRDLIGVSEEVTRLAKPAAAIMGLWTFSNQVRNLANALAMMRRRTILMSYSTSVRLVAQAGMLLAFPLFLVGALAGALSLVGAMMVESIFMYFATRPYYRDLPAGGGEQASYRQMWRFSWPVMVNQATDNGAMFVINFFLGRLASPDLAIAAFGVVNALTLLVLSPLRNVVHMSQALVHSRADMRVMLTFVNRLTLVYVALIGILFWTPLRQVILLGIMGLPGELAAYGAPAVMIMFLPALVQGYAALARGLLSAMRRTGAIAGGAVLRLATVMAVCTVTLFAPDFNGAMVGTMAVAAAFLAEALLLGWRVLHFSRSVQGELFSQPVHTAAH
jgi:O-antigen/teichoic acid export membrane protein